MMFADGSFVDLSPFIFGEQPLDYDPRCEWCESSMIGRFGEELLSNECESCAANFKREYEASGGLIEVVEPWSVPETSERSVAA